MLDTNVPSDLIRNPAGRVAGRLAAFGENRTCLSIITAAELRYGAAKRGPGRIASRVDALLGRFTVLPFDRPADVEYGRLRAILEASGRIIGERDLLIAAHALSLGLTLVTHNTAEFSRVPGLAIEDWLA